MGLSLSSVTPACAPLSARKLAAGKAQQLRRAAAAAARRGFSACRAGVSGLAAGAPRSQLAQPASDWVALGAATSQAFQRQPRCKRARACQRRSCRNFVRLTAARSALHPWLTDDAELATRLSEGSALSSGSSSRGRLPEGHSSSCGSAREEAQRARPCCLDAWHQEISSSEAPTGAQEVKEGNGCSKQERSL